MRYKLKKGFKSLNGQVEVLDEDSLCFLVRNESRGSSGNRTISKSLLNEYVEYFEEHPNATPTQAREDLAGLTENDKFEYGYTYTLSTMAKMILGSELNMYDKLSSIYSQQFHNSHQLQQIYYGAPGTGKSHKIDNDPNVNDDNTIRTTFHPDSDYSTFVGAYKPTMASMPVNAFVGTTVHHAKNAKNEDAYEKKIVYKYVPQAFLKAYVAAWSDLENPHFLIIEEINRGNCAQIFGDLFQLLDRNNSGSSSYAIHADEDITQFLAEDKNGFANLSEEQKEAIRSFVLIKDSGKTESIGDAILSGKKLLLPPNLYIWATMNTSDQSLFPIDSAFKRRWNWEYMPIDYDAKDWQFEVGGKRYLWSDFLKKINPLILSLTQSTDKQMGYFFAKADKKTDETLKENDIISEKIFLNKVLFYLWTDVLKDFEAGDKIFRDEETGGMYQFSDFFPTTNGKLAEFVGKLGLNEIGNDHKEPFDDSVEDPKDSVSDDLKLTVIFPDGEKIVGDTKFDAYSQALKKIGLDKVEPIAAEMKYKRKDSPLVSLEQKQAIVDAPDYSYVKIGDFNLIKGMNGKTMRNFLQLLSDRLNLDLHVIYE